MALGQFFGISTTGNNGVECRVYVDITDGTASSNASSIDAELQVRKSNGIASQGNMSGTFTINGTGVTISGNKTLPANGTWITLGTAGRKTIYHGADGRAPSGTSVTTVSVNSVAMSGSSDYDTAISGTLTFDSGNGFPDYDRRPSAPGTTYPTAATSDSITWSWPDPSDAGSGIDAWAVQLSLAANFSPLIYDIVVNRPHTSTGLTPSTRYYARAHAHTGDGWGDYGGAGEQITAASPPSAPTLSEPSATTIKATWNRGSNGPQLSNFDINWATDAGFTVGGGYQNVNLNTEYTMTGLTPGTTYYVRVRANSVGGVSGWSSTVTQVTLPAVPPGFTVASSPSGYQATLTFSPPGGVSGVSKYHWSIRATGDVSNGGTGESFSTTQVVGDLTPGVSYDWRASAWIGGYQSPWTAWTALVQAKPNVNAGDYFDGDSVDTVDVDYQWTGTQHLSSSIAVAKGVDGWEHDVATSGGAAVLHRVTAGLFSSYAARLQVTADATAAGLRAGQRKGAPYASEVTAGATYIGSINVRPSRSQSLAAEISWFTAADALISRTAGAASVVAGGTWVRLAGGGIAPAGAQRAVVRAIDVTGTSWSLWRGGETMDLDGAMISLNEQFPYFDGSTTSDGTYVYEWEGTAHASPSTRTPITDAQAGTFGVGGLYLPSRLSLTDPDCTVVPPPPRPPTVPSDCIDEIGVWRRYYAAIPANLVPDWMDVVPTLDITTGASPARQVRIRYYPNADALPPQQADTTSWISEQIISFIPAGTVMTMNGMTQHLTAQIGSADPLSADHLLYGTKGKPATWPVLSCGIAYLISMEVPITEPVGNISVTASLTPRIF